MSATQPCQVDPSELLDTLHKAWESAPPEVKGAVPNFVTTGGSLISVWAYYANTIAPVNNVLKYLDHAQVCNPETAKWFVHQANNNTGVIAHSQVVEDFMSSNAEVPEHVKLSILNDLQKSANTLLITSTVCAAVQVMLSVGSLWELHESLKEVRNLTKSSQLSLELISQKLKLVPEKLAELDKILMELNKQDLPMVHVTRLSNKANRVKTAIDSQLRGIVNQIDNLEVEIQSKTVRLGAARRQAYMAAVGGIVNSATSCASIGLLHGAANPYVLGIAGVVAACNVVLGVGCPVYAYVTDKELEKIQARLDDICKVKANVEELEIKLTEHVDLIYDRIDELTETDN